MRQYFIRRNTAVTMARRMQYLNEPLDVAAKWVVDDLKEVEGDGGVIAVDSDGNGACSS